jgi:hypothetical protein
MNNIPHIIDTGASVMNDEPVAWMSNGKEFYVQKNYCPDFIPLYTHPAKELDEQFKKGFEAGKEEGWKAHKFHHPVKELTDEEIWELSDMVLNNSDVIGFARAILRKAQEK